MDTPSSDTNAPADSKPEAPKSPPPVEVAPIVRQQQMKLGRRNLRYTTVAGRMPLKNEADEIEAQLYFTAYTLGHGEADRKRPLTFVFNGGPGSASVTSSLDRILWPPHGSWRTSRVAEKAAARISVPEAR